MLPQVIVTDDSAAAVVDAKRGNPNVDDAAARGPRREHAARGVDRDGVADERATRGADELLGAADETAEPQGADDDGPPSRDVLAKHALGEPDGASPILERAESAGAAPAHALLNTTDAAPKHALIGNVDAVTPKAMNVVATSASSRPAAEADMIDAAPTCGDTPGATVGAVSPGAAPPRTGTKRHSPNRRASANDSSKPPTADQADGSAKATPDRARESATALPRVGAAERPRRRVLVASGDAATSPYMVDRPPSGGVEAFAADDGALDDGALGGAPPARPLAREGAADDDAAVPRAAPGGHGHGNGSAAPFNSAASAVGGTTAAIRRSSDENPLRRRSGSVEARPRLAWHVCVDAYIYTSPRPH